MNAHTQEHRDYGFVLGLFTGTVVGAGLAMWLVPRLASELRERVTDSARSFGQRASEQHQQASTRVGAAPLLSVSRAGSHALRGKTMSRRDLLDERRFAVGKPRALFSRVHGREHVPPRDTSGRCEVGCQMFTVRLPAQDEDARRLH